MHRTEGVKCLRDNTNLANKLYTSAVSRYQRMLGHNLNPLINWQIHG